MITIENITKICNTLVLLKLVTQLVTRRYYLLHVLHILVQVRGVITIIETARLPVTYLGNTSCLLLNK